VAALAAFYLAAAVKVAVAREAPVKAVDQVETGSGWAAAVDSDLEVRG
jgi:hypothetical protein